MSTLPFRGSSSEVQRFGTDVAYFAFVNIGFYQSATGMMANLEHQNAIATNLSRQSVTGSRQSVTSFVVDKRFQPADNSSQASSKVEMKGDSLGVTTVSRIDFSQGPVTRTGSPLNVAIQGEAFFCVREKSGDITYTRNGNFYRDAEGNVLTDDGASLLRDGNSPLVVQDAYSVVIDSEGTIRDSQTANEIGKLALAHFDNPSEALKEGNFSRFVPHNQESVREGKKYSDKILQGHLEGGNAQPVIQMVNMIQTMRAYEANQKAIAAQDESTGRLLQTVGRA